MSTKIFVGNLSDGTESDDVRVLFEKYGTVEECDVLKSYGFVHMPSKSEASAAITNLNGYNIKGQRMRVEFSTGKRGNPKGDRRGFDRDGERGGRPRPYPPGPPRRGPPPPDFDRYDPYYRYPYPERDPYYRLPPVDRYLPPRLPPVDDRYPPPPRERYPEERGGYPPMDPRDRMMARERLARYPDEYDRLRPAERLPPPADPYYRDRSPPPSSRPPPEYYDRKAPLIRAPAASTAAAAAAAPPPSSSSSRLNTTAYPPANGYDYYRNPAEASQRPSYGGAASTQGYKNGPAGATAGYDRAAAPQQPRTGPTQPQQGPGGAGGYGMPQQQAQANRYDSQSALQTRPIFF